MIHVYRYTDIDIKWEIAYMAPSEYVFKFLVSIKLSFNDFYLHF